MAIRNLTERVEVLEMKVGSLEELPARMSAVESQIVQLRSEMHGEFSAVRQEMRDLGGTLRQEMRALNEETDRLLEELNLAERRDLPAGLLSYAEQRALEIGMTIAGGASMVLLDEPTAGMSHSETEYAVALIRRVTQGKTLVMVEHDMRVVFDLADTITVLVYGKVIASGPPTEIRSNRAVQEAYLGAIAA